MRANSVRAQHAAIVSKMLLVVFRIIRDRYSKKRSLGACYPEMLAIMMIRINDATDNPPISAAAIARQAEIPRATISRALARLLREGFISKTDGGYVGNETYILQVGEQPKDVVTAAVRAAAEALNNLPR